VTRSSLISGASVAGTAAVYWLGQHGYSVTVAERHPGLRSAGQAIDVRGPALTVRERMGLLAAQLHRAHPMVSHGQRSRGAPTPRDEFYRAVHSITLKDY